MYIQKIVPLRVRMLQMPNGYDVISYRIEHIKTIENVPLTDGIEKIFFPEIPEKYINKYKIGIKTAPFVRIYRTIAPHSEVEKTLKSGKNRLSIFENPRLVKNSKEEICYSSNNDQNFMVDLRLSALHLITIAASAPLTGDEKQSPFKDKERKYRKNIVPKLKHKANKFIRKCLAVDDFFSDAMTYFNDPTDLHREEIINEVVKLDYIFDECEELDPDLPEGFADKTSALTKDKIAEILTVIETLKWQVGINSNIDNYMFRIPLDSRDLLWDSSNEKAVFLDVEERYIEKGLGKEYGCIVDEYTDVVCYPMPLMLNPHKTSIDPMSPFPGVFLFSDFLDYLADPKSYWTHKKNNFAIKTIYNAIIPANSHIYNELDELDTLEANKKKIREIFSDLITKKIKTFNKEFIEGFLDKRVEEYPVFISERLKNPDNYPGMLLYMFDPKKCRHKPEEVDPDPLSYGGQPDSEYCIFNLFNEGEECAYNILFDISYLIDYSDTLMTAREAEDKKLTVHKALQKIQSVDPKDNIASRLLAEIISRDKISKSILLNEWSTASAHKLFDDTKGEDNPQEIRAVKAFKIYRKTIKELMQAISIASSKNLSMDFNKDSNKLPSLYSMVNNYLLDTLWSYSRIPLNREFGKESVQREVHIIDYVRTQNERSRLTRNKFAHGEDIDSYEFMQFTTFCSKIERVSADIVKGIEKNHS